MCYYCGMRIQIKRVLRYLALISGVLIGGFCLVAGLIYLQNRQSEVRRADAIVLSLRTGASDAVIDYAVDLYRRGFAARLILAGGDPQLLAARIGERGLPGEAALVISAGEEEEAIRQAAELARANGIASVLLISDPHDLLLQLKMLRDQGLEAYAAPAPQQPVQLAAVTRASLAYWRYVLGLEW